MEETNTTNDVPQQMNDVSPVAGETEEEHQTFASMLEESLTNRSIQVEEVAKGRVVQITSDYIIVDVGYKSEGQIPVDEFMNDDRELTVKEGDEVDVYIEDWENENGMMVLSKEKADRMRVWDRVSKVYEDDGVIEGRIVSRIKGGLAVDIGLKAFLPGSQIDLHPVKELDRLLGKTFEFKILKLSKKRGNIVLSRRAILEKERESLRAETLQKLEEGAVLSGIVKNITDYGVFIDLGGVDGLLHVTDISWGRITSPQDYFSIGDKIEVKILSYDRENQRVALGYKQLKPNPWETVQSKYPVESRITGKVVNITNYGCFIELEEGVEGLIHISEMSWTKKIKHPSQVLSIGDHVEAVVLDMDVPRKRISLGIKQLEPNPWSVIEEKYPVGTVVEGKIKNITDFGIFIGLDEGIDGLVHISDISWTQKIKHPGERYKKGDMVKAVVLSIDKTHERFSLGIKQIEPDPWEDVPQRYRRGQVVKGTVTNVTDFGIFLELEEGIEGLVHISEVGEEKAGSIKDFAATGDELEVLIISIDKRNRKIGLSLRELSEGKEKDEMNQFMEQQAESTPNATLGDLMTAQKASAADNASADTQEPPQQPLPDEQPQEGPADHSAEEMNTQEVDTDEDTIQQDDPARMSDEISVSENARHNGGSEPEETEVIETPKPSQE